MTIGDWLKDTHLQYSFGNKWTPAFGWIFYGWLDFISRSPRPARKVAGIIAVAPAVDMTEHALSNLSTKAKKRTIKTGVWMRPSNYDPEGYPITRKLLEEGRSHLLLPGPIEFFGPVRILHGMEDKKPPWGIIPENCRSINLK